jgi:two-component system heavy metal sensor histidine kinase CusS
MKSRSSIGARLIAVFAAINLVCFGLLGWHLERSFEAQVTHRDETALLLNAANIRAFVCNMTSYEDISHHEATLQRLIDGAPALAVVILDPSGRTLLRYGADADKMPGKLMPVMPFVVAPADIQSWRSADGFEARGITAGCSLDGGEHVTVSMGQSVAAGKALMLNHRGDMVIAVAIGVLTVLLLSIVLVKRALRPLAAMADGARAISAHSLHSRLSLGAAPRELEVLAAELNDMLGRLENGFDRVWQFTVDLAHDLRTPIGNLRGANEVALAHRRTPDEYEQLLESNIEECDRVSRMIESVLFLARAESPQFALRRSRFDAAEELQRVADYFEGPSSEKGIAIRVEAQMTLEVDRDLFRRALSNLVDNAIRHAYRDTTVSLTAEQTGELFRVTITNLGEGIDQDHLTKVFDRFYRLDKSRQATGGSNGLGLSIVRTIVELHGGRVGVESDPDGTTRFSMLFPAPL